MTRHMDSVLRTTLVALIAMAGMHSARADVPDSWCHAEQGCDLFGNSHSDHLVPAGSTLRLEDDTEYHNLTLGPGATLDTQGYVLRVCGTLWIKPGAVITDTYTGGRGGQGGEAGAGADPWYQGSPNRCLDRDVTCRPGGDGEPGQPPLRPCGGHGGRGGGGGGGGGGAMRLYGQQIDADGGDGAPGGDGGQGGGCVYVYAFRLVNEGTIQADGQSGGDGDDAPSPGWTNCGAEYYRWWMFPHDYDLAGGGGGGGGGGCGGDGGSVVVVVGQDSGDFGDVHANGGIGGHGGQGGAGGGCLLYGAPGEWQDGCRGGAGCGSGGHGGGGGQGGRGAKDEGDCGHSGLPGEDGNPGQPGTCTLIRTCWGDVNGDYAVDLSDLATCLAAYGSSEGDPNYNSCCDLNQDGSVGLEDLAELLANYPCAPEISG